MQYAAGTIKTKRPVVPLAIHFRSEDTVAMLTVYLRKNPFSNRKKPYSWHARSEGRVSHEKLLEAVAQANTTVTKADVLAVICEYERQFLRALQEGCSVESFFGTLSVGATGSAEKESERFNPRKSKDRRTPPRDHKLTLNFKAKPAFLQQVRNGLRFRTEQLQKLCEPEITFVGDGNMEEGMAFRPGDIVHVRGRFLKIAPADGEQGAFLRGKGKSFRLDRYSRCTRCSIDSLIPDDIPPGEYRIEVRTSPSGSLHVSNTIAVTVVRSS